MARHPNTTADLRDRVQVYNAFVGVDLISNHSFAQAWNLLPSLLYRSLGRVLSGSIRKNIVVGLCDSPSLDSISTSHRRRHKHHPALC